MKKIIIYSSLFVMSFSAFANTNEQYPIQVEAYVEMYNVSKAEAEKAMLLEANQEQIIDAITDEFKGRIAGIYKEHNPYKMVVRVKENGKKMTENRLFSIDGINEKMPIEIIYGAKEAAQIAKGQVNKAYNLVNCFFTEVQDSGYDEKTGEIIVRVTGEETPANMELVQTIQRKWNNPKIPLKVEFVNFTLNPLNYNYVLLTH
ncbi:hypothetical protein VH441_08000 [Psychrobacter sp. HD31]|uniref:hypothetical protein n=1 Tax=Psychrobacter sp. HD31 TaxID=3112003 RepID=UPI003DA2DBB7